MSHAQVLTYWMIPASKGANKAILIQLIKRPGDLGIWNYLSLFRVAVEEHSLQNTSLRLNQSLASPCLDTV